MFKTLSKWKLWVKLEKVKLISLSLKMSQLLKHQRCSPQPLKLIQTLFHKALTVLKIVWGTKSTLDQAQCCTLILTTNSQAKVWCKQMFARKTKVSNQQEGTWLKLTAAHRLHCKDASQTRASQNWDSIQHLREIFRRAQGCKGDKRKTVIDSSCSKKLGSLETSIRRRLLKR